MRRNHIEPIHSILGHHHPIYRILHRRRLSGGVGCMVISDSDTIHSMPACFPPIYSPPFSNSPPIPLLTHPSLPFFLSCPFPHSFIPTSLPPFLSLPIPHLSLTHHPLPFIPIPPFVHSYSLSPIPALFSAIILITSLLPSCSLPSPCPLSLLLGICCCSEIHFR